MVGMPVFIDQGDVLRRMIDAGIGVGVSKSASGEELYRAILEVRDNPIYKHNIDKLSRVFRDKRCAQFASPLHSYRSMSSGLIPKMWLWISSSLSEGREEPST